MTVDEAVDKASKEAAAILAGRSQENFYGEIGVKFRDGTIVTVEIKETIRAS